MTSYIAGGILSSHLPAARGKDDPQTEHRCALCYGPYGKSAIKCRNEPATTQTKEQTK